MFIILCSQEGVFLRAELSSGHQCPFPTSALFSGTEFAEI